MNPPTHDSLIDAINDCALDPDAWDKTLDRIRQYLGASAVNVIDLGVGVNDNPLIYSSNLPLDQGHIYRDYWHKRDPWVKGLSRTGLDIGGVTYCGGQLLERSELIKTPFYNEWLAGLDIQDVLGVNLWSRGSLSDHDSEQSRIVLGLYRSSSAAPFSEAERKKLEGLSRHLNRAFRIGLRMGALARNSQHSEAALNALRQAVIALDINARILTANPAGVRLLEQTPEWLRVRDGRLIGFALEHSPTLEEALTLGRQGRARLLTWRVTCPEGLPAMVTLRLATLQETVILGLPGQRTAHMLIIEASSQIDDEAYQSFCDLYRLSSAERKVLRQLMQDSSAEGIAQSLKISPATVRTHFQNIRYKIGVRRIADVVSMALSASRAV